ncbi:MAG: nuclear transport factor 2 family protein [Haliea sp.]
MSDLTLDTLVAERAIYRNLVQVARGMDARDWNGLLALMSADVTADLGTGPLSGGAEIIGLLRSFLDACGPTQHLLGNVLIDVDGDTARSRAYVSDMHLGTGAHEGLTFSTLGDYHDHWRREAGEWKLCHRTKLNRGHLGSFSVLGPGPDHWQA